MLEEAAHSPEFAVAADDEALLLGREVLPGHIERNARRARIAPHLGGERPVLRLGPRLDGAFGQRQRLVRDDQIQVEVDGVAEALAARTGAERIVEGEQPRLGLLVADVALLALEALRKAQALWRLRPRAEQSQTALRPPRGIPAPPRPRCAARTSGETEMRSISTNTGSAKLRSSSDSGVENSTICAILIEPVEATLAQLEEALFQQGIVSLLGWLLLCGPAALCLLRLRGRRRRLHREEHLHSGAFAEREDAVGDFVHRVLLHLLAAVQAVGAAHARVQQAQVVVDLGGGGDGRARIAGGVLLPDGDCRRDAVDHVDVGLLDALQELARVGRQRLDVAALALGVDGVERERRLARPRDAGHHRQRVVRNLEVDVLQVVDARSAYDDAVVRHGPENRRQPGRAAHLVRPPHRLLQQRLPKLLIIAVC